MTVTEYLARMPGPKPRGDHALTPAERAAAYRERRKAAALATSTKPPVMVRYRAAHADGAPKVKYRKPADRRSRPQRWSDAVVELVELQGGYQTWLDALPPNLADSATAEALRAICEFDLSELENLEPPRGFGRD